MPEMKLGMQGCLIRRYGAHNGASEHQWQKKTGARNQLIIPELASNPVCGPKRDFWHCAVSIKFTFSSPGVSWDMGWRQ
jgi:hypothetical protein